MGGSLILIVIFDEGRHRYGYIYSRIRVRNEKQCPLNRRITFLGLNFNFYTEVSVLKHDLVPKGLTYFHTEFSIKRFKHANMLESVDLKRAAAT